MNDDLLRTVIQVICGLYLAFTSGWRLNRLSGPLSTFLVIGYVLLGAGAFLLALHPFIGSLMNWGELTLVIGVVLVTMPYSNIWRQDSLVQVLNRSSLLSVQSSHVTSRKGIVVLALVLAGALFGLDRLSGILGSPPIRVIAIEPESTVIRYGEPLRVTYTIRRYYPCPATIYDSFIATDKTNALIRLTPVPAGFTKVGITKVLRVIKTMGVDASGDTFNLEPGEYLYTSFSRHKCKLDGHEHVTEFVIQQPQVRVHVERLDSPEIQQ